MLERPRRLARKLRRHAGAILVDNFFRGLATAGRLHPHARPAHHNVEVLRDIPYLPTGRRAHRLDVYRPTQKPGPWPTVLYVHGGGFRILSKDSHWIMGLAFARAGYIVFNISYRLAPRHPFPAALEDACAAYGWLAQHGAAYSADLERLALAGESAGGNLVTALAIAASYERPEPFAAQVFATGLTPRAALPACGMLQVSDTARFGRIFPNLSPFLIDRLVEIEEAYLRRARAGSLDLADPLVVLERAQAPARPLPAFFVPCGTKDPLIDDSRRLARALERLGVPCETRYYEGEPHAFHALVTRPNARRCWGHTYAFLERALAVTEITSETPSSARSGVRVGS
ncbi:MAG TPA: alpha/beta hydrolase [Polyangia bacterium]|nr:alpha/beta hydrolase [Polyangia bacterium]